MGKFFCLTGAIISSLDILPVGAALEILMI